MERMRQFRLRASHQPYLISTISPRLRLDRAARTSEWFPETQLKTSTLRAFKSESKKQLFPDIMDGTNLLNNVHSRKSSKANAMPLTEYAANPIPPVNKSPASSQVPEAFLLPDGFPDVINPHESHAASTKIEAVSTPYPDFPCLRRRQRNSLNTGNKPQ